MTPLLVLLIGTILLGAGAWDDARRQEARQIQTRADLAMTIRVRWNALVHDPVQAEEMAWDAERTRGQQEAKAKARADLGGDLASGMAWQAKYLLEQLEKTLVRES